jgi:ABC-type thiamine transport system substrate-binding protein
MQGKILFNEQEMLKDLLNKEKKKKAITMKGNLSAPGLDGLTFPILKYEKDGAAELMVNIRNMMIRVQKSSEAWKEDKMVMIPKPCEESEREKKRKTGDQ